MSWERPIAGFFVGIGAVALIYYGHIAEATALLGAMLGFFIGEANGKRTAQKDTAEA